MAKWDRKKCDDCIVGFFVDGYGEDGALVTVSDVVYGDKIKTPFNFCPICGNQLVEEDTINKLDNEVNSLL